MGENQLVKMELWECGATEAQGKQEPRRTEWVTQGTLSRKEGSTEDDNLGNHGKKHWDGVVGSEVRED